MLADYDHPCIVYILVSDPEEDFEQLDVDLCAQRSMYVLIDTENITTQEQIHSIRVNFHKHFPPESPQSKFDAICFCHNDKDKSFVGCVPVANSFYPVRDAFRRLLLRNGSSEESVNSIV